MYAESRQPVFKRLTPKDAEKFLSINNFPGQRAYNSLKGKSYADGMIAGTHRRIEIAVCNVKENGQQFLMNGQHNCNAVIIAKMSHPAIVSHYNCETMEDAWRLFSTFDVHASRTERQLISSRKGLFSDERLHAININTLGACATALYILKDGLTSPYFSANSIFDKTKKADLLDEYADDVVLVSKYAMHNHLRRVGVLVCMIATFRKNKTKADEFWSKVATGEMLARNDHRYKLRDHLMDVNALAAMRGGACRQKHMYMLCASWWNSWIKGEERCSVKIKGMTDLPKILG